jgi:hypothetical protein
LTPREFQALTEVWRHGREFQQGLYAEVYAGLRNAALQVGLKPPAGEFWTAQMFMPGWQPPQSRREYDWQTQKALMNRIGKRSDRKKRAAEAEAQASTKDRFRQVEEARKRGASREEIRLIMEA